MKGKKIYIVGIGGIGNSALAQLLKHEGAEVSGSDRVVSPTTAMLEAAGIKVHIGHSATQVAEDTDMLIYTDAIVEGSDGYVERLRARELGIPELSYFETLGKMSEGKKVVAISGTNGKTTTTAMIGKILVDAGEDPTVVVGSIVADFHSNFHPSLRSGPSASNLFVAEADEFRRHFLSLRPHTLIITNIELDHTDYYKDLDDIVSAFHTLADVTDQAGDIITNTSSETIQKAVANVGARVVAYQDVEVPELMLPGEFNRENARAAKAAVHALAPHIKDEVIDAALASFRGTWRRFEYKGLLPKGAQLYDDYAHHPTAIEKTITAAREKFPNKKIVLFFHPHLYSRTRDSFAGFSQALAKADEVFILPVYAAREAFDPTVSSEALAKAVNEEGGNAAAIAGMTAVTQKLQELGADVVAFTMGAGDVYKAGEDALR